MESIKIVAVGNYSVGKTCLLISFSSGLFPEEYIPTVFDNYSANVVYNKRCFNLALWDTSGGEEYWRIRPLSYPCTDVFLICCSVARKPSFEAVLQGWYPEIKQHCPTAKIVLVGTKIDVRKSKEYMPRDSSSYRPMDFVTVRQGREFARKIGAYGYVECSSLHKKNLKEVFDLVIAAAINHRPGNDIQQKKTSIFTSLKTKFKKTTKVKNGKLTNNLAKKDEHATSPYTRFAHTAAYVHFIDSNDSNNNNNKSHNTKGVYMFGGYKTITNELADPLFWDGAENWTKLEVDSSVFSPRSFLCSAVVYSSLFVSNSPTPVVLLFGGKSNGYHNDTVAFDIYTRTFHLLEVTGQIPTPRYGMTGGTYNNEMIIFGGFDNNSEPCNDCFKFNLETKCWSRLSLTDDVPSPRYFHASAVANDLNLLVVYGGKCGGSVLDDLTTINLVTGKCRKITPTTDFNPGSRQNHSCNYIGTGNILLIGGADGNKTVHKDALVFSLETHQWIEFVGKRDTLPVICHSSSLTENDEIWVTGGKDAEDTLYLATKLRVTKKAHLILDTLPKSILQSILLHLTAFELANFSQVSSKFHLVAYEIGALWEPIAREIDPEYAYENDGDPRLFCSDITAPVWYNDFSVPPIPPLDHYVMPHHPNFTCY